MQTPTKLTFCRIVSAPVFFILYCLPGWIEAPFLRPLSVYIMIPFLALAEFTDYLDGKYARMHNQVSGFGKVFDPFADVFLNVTVFFCLVLSGYMPALIFLFITYREISMTFIRLVAVQEGIAIGARGGGKAKTVLYIVSCFFSLSVESALRIGLLGPEDPFVRTLKTAGIVLFVLCLAVSYISFADYLFTFRKVLLGKKK